MRRIELLALDRMKLFGGIAVLSLALVGCNPDRLPSAPTEVDRPLLAEEVMDPVGQSIMVDRETDIVLHFNEPMDPSTFENHLLVIDPEGVAVEGSYEAEGSSVVFSPAEPLRAATYYDVELRGRIKDANGNSIEKNGQPVLDDTTLIWTNWLFSDGSYAAGAPPMSYVLDLRGRVWMVEALQEEAGFFEVGRAPKGLAGIGDRLAVLNSAEQQVAILDAATGEGVSTVDVAADPVAMAGFEDRVYVVSAGGQAITVVDVAAGNLVSTLELDFYPGMIALSPDGSRLYTLNQVSGALVTLDAATGEVLATLPSVVRVPVTGEILTDPGDGTVYVADTQGDKLRIVSASGGELIETLDGESREVTWKPFKLAIEGASLWIAPHNTNVVHRMDTQSQAIAQTYTFGSPVKGLEVLTGGNPVLVLTGSEVVVLDEGTGTHLRTISLDGSNPNSSVTIR